MWTDERGSEVLGPPECRQLLAIGAKEHLHGHLAVAGDPVPIVVPLDYSVHESDVIVQVGEGLFADLVDRLVAFQVDGKVGRQGLCGIEDVAEWSVLVQGLATEVVARALGHHAPHPRVAHPGRRVVRIRTDVLSGRRLPPAGEGRRDDRAAPAPLHLR
jgi:hypothetical protein